MDVITGADFPAALEGREKDAVLNRWINLVFATYAPDTAAILKAGGDRFANPVSYAISSNLRLILDGLVEGREAETLSPYLEEIIKIRAVQDFSQKDAISFMALLKKALSPAAGIKAAAEINRKIDLLSEVCSDIYVDYRSRIDRIRADEQRKNARYISRLSGGPGDGE